jgi:hypothetical protein
MARKRRSSMHGTDKVATPRTRRVRALPEKPGTTVHYIDPGTVVVVSRRAGGGAGGAGGLGATIDVCKCVKTEFKCTTTNGHTTCKEQCVEWDCQEIPMARQ